MHSHDQTKLAQFGFVDPDKKDPRHDLGIQYLAYLANNGDLAKLAINRILNENLKFKSILFEQCISKGHEKYRTTIGFIDAVILFSHTDSGRLLYKPCAFEIKTIKTSVSDIVRQIEFYRQSEHYICNLGHFTNKLCDFNWFIVTAFSLSASEIEILKTSNIFHIKFGPGFDKWMKERENQPESDESIII